MAELRYVQGLKPISKLLLELPVKLRRKYLIPSTQAATWPVRDEAKALAPQWHGDVSKGHPPPGTLKAAIVSYFVPEKSSATRVTFHIKPRVQDKERTTKKTQRAIDPTTGRRAKGYIRYIYTDKLTQFGAYYWWWVEFGSVNNAPVGYMRRAFQNKVDQAITVFRDRLWDSVKVVVQEGGAR